jgi:hypothetical protein
MSTIPIRQPDSLSETKRKLLEGYREGGLARNLGSSRKITPRLQGRVAPLSWEQEQILRREQKAAGGSLPHNECITLKPNKYLAATILERCFAEIVRRHEIWRTSYGIADGQPIQLVHDASHTFPLQIIDLRAASGAARETELLKLYTQGVRQPFDLERGPLIRVMLVNLSDTDQRVLLFAHLSIVDGVSVYQILPVELVSLYDAFWDGKFSPLPELPIQYGDYAYWQRQWLRSEEVEKQLTYWRGELGAELPVLPWPVDRPRRTVRRHRGEVRSFTLRPSLRHSLKQFSVREGVTLFTTLATSLGALLYSYTGQDHIILGTPSLGARKRSEIGGLLGHFLNPVPLHIDLQGEPAFHELLARVQQVVGGALAHDDVPLDLIAQELRLSSASSGNHLFNVAISLQPETSRTGWQVTSMDADSGGTIWDLYLAFIETRDGLIGRAQYNADLFDETTIMRALEGLQVVMESVTSYPNQTISALPSQLRSWGLL